MEDLDKILDFVKAGAEHYGIDKDLAFAMFETESQWNPKARSKVGALGIAQLMPSTARDLGVDPYDTWANIDGGLRYLKQQLDTFKDPSLAVAAYNAGPGAVKRDVGIPQNDETPGHVQKVMDRYRQIQAAREEEKRSKILSQLPDPSKQIPEGIAGELSRYGLLGPKGPVPGLGNPWMGVELPEVSKGLDMQWPKDIYTLPAATAFFGGAAGLVRPFTTPLSHLLAAGAYPAAAFAPLSEAAGPPPQLEPPRTILTEAYERSKAAAQELESQTEELRRQKKLSLATEIPMRVLGGGAMGMASYMAGVPFAAVEGAMEGYEQGALGGLVPPGYSGALVGALEGTVRRYLLGKAFRHVIPERGGLTEPLTAYSLSITPETVWKEFARQMGGASAVGIMDALSRGQPLPKAMEAAAEMAILAAAGGTPQARTMRKGLGKEGELKVRVKGDDEYEISKSAYDEITQYFKPLGEKLQRETPERAQEIIDLLEEDVVTVPTPPTTLESMQGLRAPEPPTIAEPAARELPQPFLRIQGKIREAQALRGELGPDAQAKAAEMRTELVEARKRISTIEKNTERKAQQSAEYFKNRYGLDVEAYEKSPNVWGVRERSGFVYPLNIADKVEAKEALKTPEDVPVAEKSFEAEYPETIGRMTPEEIAESGLNFADIAARETTKTPKELSTELAQWMNDRYKEKFGAEPARMTPGKQRRLFNELTPEELQEYWKLEGEWKNAVEKTRKENETVVEVKRPEIDWGLDEEKGVPNPDPESFPLQGHGPDRDRPFSSMAAARIYKNKTGRLGQPVEKDGKIWLDPGKRSSSYLFSYPGPSMLDRFRPEDRPRIARVLPFFHSADDLRNIASRTGRVKLYHGAPRAFAEDLVANVGARGADVAWADAPSMLRSVAKLYDIPYLALYHKTGAGHLVDSYAESKISRSSTAPAEVASRWATSFPYGEIITELNNYARLYKEAQRRGEDFDAFLDREADKYSGPLQDLADKMQLPDLLREKRKGGALVEIEVDARAIPETIVNRAKSALRAIEQGSMSEDQAMLSWNTNYKDIKIHPSNFLSAKIVADLSEHVEYAQPYLFSFPGQVFDPKWYSRLHEAAAVDIVNWPKRMTQADLSERLRRLAKAGKMDIEEWNDVQRLTGIKQFLESWGDKKIPRDEVLNAIMENGIQVEERWLEEGKADASTVLGRTEPKYGSGSGRVLKRGEKDGVVELIMLSPQAREVGEDYAHYATGEGRRLLGFARVVIWTDNEGRRIANIDNLQSTRFQKGRQEGYADSGIMESIRAARNRIDQIDRDVLNTPYPQRADLIDERNRLRELEDTLVSQSGGVPDAPFRESWKALLLRRVIRYAVENNIDHISWTTGEQQRERWGGGEHFNELYGGEKLGAPSPEMIAARERSMQAADRFLQMLSKQSSAVRNYRDAARGIYLRGMEDALAVGEALNRGESPSWILNQFRGTREARDRIGQLQEAWNELSYKDRQVLKELESMDRAVDRARVDEDTVAWEHPPTKTFSPGIIWEDFKKAVGSQFKLARKEFFKGGETPESKQRMQQASELRLQLEEKLGVRQSERDQTYISLDDTIRRMRNEAIAVVRSERPEVFTLLGLDAETFRADQFEVLPSKARNLFYSAAQRVYDLYMPEIQKMRRVLREQRQEVSSIMEQLDQVRRTVVALETPDPLTHFSQQPGFDITPELRDHILSNPSKLYSFHPVYITPKNIKELKRELVKGLIDKKEGNAGVARLYNADDILTTTRVAAQAQWIAKNVPRLKPIVYSVLGASERTAQRIFSAMSWAKDYTDLSKTQRADLTEFFFKLNGKKYADLGITEPKFNKLANEDVQLNPKHYEQWTETMKKHLPAELLGPATDIRIALDQALADKWNQGRQYFKAGSEGFKALTNEVHEIPNYVPQSRSGRWALEGWTRNKEGKDVKVVDVGFNPMMGMFTAQRAAGNVMGRDVKLIEKYAEKKFLPKLREDPIVKQLGDLTWTVSRRPSDTISMQNSQPILMMALNDILGRVAESVPEKFQSAFRQAVDPVVANEVKKRGQWGHWAQRQGIYGYDMSDIGHTVREYIQGHHSIMGKAEMMKELSELAKNVDLTRPEETEWAKNYITSMASRGGEVSSALHKLRTLAYLQFISPIKYFFMNMTNALTHGAPMLAEHVGPVADKYLMKNIGSVAMWKTGRGEIRADKARMFKELYEEGPLRAQFLDQVGQALDQSPAAWAKGLAAKGLAVFNWPAKSSEILSRAATAGAAYDAFLDGKIKNEKTLAEYQYGREKTTKPTEEQYQEAKRFAEEAVHDSHSVFTEANRPEWQRMSEAGRVAGSTMIFRHFMQHTYHMWSHMARQGPLGIYALIRSIAMTTALGGLAAFPLAKTMASLYQDMTGDDPWEKIRNAAGDAGDFMIHGIPALLGFDASNSFDMDLPSQMEDLLGVPGSWAKGIMQAGKSLSVHDYQRAFEAVFPLKAARDISVAIRGSTTGLTSPSGAPINYPSEAMAGKPYKFRDSETLMQSLGFNPLEVSKIREVKSSLRSIEEFHKSKQDELATRLINAWRQNDQLAQDDVLKETMRWNAEWLSKGKPEYVIKLQDAIKSRMHMAPPRKAVRHKIPKLEETWRK